MANRRSVVEWVETTEEVVATEENLPPDDCPHEGCDECLTLFRQQTEPSANNGPSFILDFPASAGVPQRALLTLPYGLMVGRSSIPSAGVGVFNQGATVSPGMHFGPYEGEVSTKESALASDFSWEIHKGKDEYEYIDAARESHSNWMRYVKFARNEDEKNLVAVQYKGTIIFHCCRSINAGEELMVWPGTKLFTQLSEAWNRVWCVKLNAAESNAAAATSEIFTCCYCQLSFTTEAYLQLHTDYFHLQPEGGSAAQSVTVGEESPSGAAVVRPAAPSSEDPVRAKTCSDCGKSFKQIRHLRRHKRCVHQNKRPYCCQQCRRSFSQASGFIRHQLTHKKQGLVKERTAAPDRDKDVTPPPDASEAAETRATTAIGELLETATETETENRMSEVGEHLVICSDCGQSFSNGAALKEHKVAAHSVLRPYVCSVCRMCFRQYCDLARHLQRHKAKGQRTEHADPPQGETSAAASSPCTDRSRAFPSEDVLQQHRSVHQSEETPGAPPLANREEEPASADDNRNPDPDFTPPVVRSPSQRPQRVGARSKLSALTKLIAPKRRAAICRKSSVSGAAQAERAGEPETPGFTELTAKNGGGKEAKYKWYSCSHCKVTFTEADELEAHRCTWKQHRCDQCGATFKKIGFLNRHERVVHAEAKSYSCDNCGTAFSKAGKLEQHKKACEKYYCTSELFPCSFCQFSFTMKRYLVKHIRRHHPVEFVSQCDSLMGRLEEDEEEEEEDEEEEMEEKEYSCPHCAKSYLSARAYKAHTCFQQVKILYLCTDCGKGFTNQYSLKQHQRIHTGEKPYSCPHCAKSFTYTGQLNVHLRTHTGEKPYLCTHCGESFRQSGDLKRHERKHTGVRPHSCPDCCKSFSRPQSLKAHQMLHLGQRMFKCTQCGKSFSRNYHLRRHHQKMHS